MIADLQKLYDICMKLGFDEINRTKDTLEITLLKDIVLEIMNIDNEKDSLIGFKDHDWHSHTSVMFTNTSHYYVKLDYYQILQGFKEGFLMVADEIKDNKVIDRFPIHKDYCDDLDDLLPGEALLIRRVR